MTSIVLFCLLINHVFMVSEETGERICGGERFDAADEAAILEAFCRAQRTALPPGSRGRSAAMDLLAAIPAACRLGWTDVTVSAPELFRMFIHAGLITSYPTACDMPAALRLVASGCELVVQRSPRRWTVWLSRACDPEDALFVSIREAVTSAMLRRSMRTAPGESPARTSSDRGEREQLAAELARAQAELASLNESYAAVQAEIANARAEAKAAKHEVAKLKKQHATLRDTSLQAERERDGVLRMVETSGKKAQRELEQSRREAEKLRVEKLALEDKNSDQLAELAYLRTTSEQQIKRWRDGFHKLADDTSRIEGVLHEIHNIFEIDEYDADEPDSFVRAVEQKNSEKEEYAEHVAIECAHALDVQISGYLASYVRLSLRIKGVDIERGFQEQLPELRGQIVETATRVRAKLAKKGVHLPPAQAHV